MKAQVKALLIVSALAVFSSLGACKQASYEINRPGEQPAPAPQPVAPPTTEDPKQPDPVTPANQGPQAKVEVLLADKLVEKVATGSTVTIRPSKDTMDGEDSVNQDTCPNPGIVRVDFDFGDGKFTSVTRKGCEALSVTHTYSRAGSYVVTMIVYTGENEQVKASRNLTVEGGSSGCCSCCDCCYSCGSTYSSCGTSSSSCGQPVYRNPSTSCGSSYVSGSTSCGSGYQSGC